VQSELNALRRKYTRLQKENENVTHLYKQAAALRDFNEKEKETQMRYNQMLQDNSPDDIYLLDLKLNVLLCTSSIKKRMGRDVSDEPFLPIMYEMFGEEYACEIEGALYQLLLKHEDSSAEDDGYELHAETSGEERLYYSINISPALDQKGEVNGIVVLAHDITEMHEANVRAEAATQAKSSFLANMSHEIRTPMNAILGITEIQLQNDSLSPGVMEAFDKIYNSGYMLLGIINDILDLSKIEAGKLELGITDYRTASLINDTVQLNMTRIGSKPIKFELKVDENTPRALIGDELRVKQILNNILSNAFKYTAEGVVELSVYPEAERNERRSVATIVFRVSDTGQGMTQEQVGKLFDEYSRFNQEANRSTEGTGLGMNITQRLIQMMNGKIQVESEPGKGSVFTVSIPQGKTDDQVLGKELAENLQQFHISSSDHVKRMQITREPMPYGSVLIVDDVETNIYVAGGLLAPYGLKIDSADSGFASIDLIKRGNVYDVVFMDHMMPEMDGMEATKIIRDMGYTQPIVALTANAVAGQAEIFLESGFDDFISKPIDIRQLNTVLNKLVRDKQPPEVLEAARSEAARREAAEQEAKSGRATDGASGRAPSNAPPANSAPDSGTKPAAAPAPKGATKPALDPRFAEVFARDARKAIGILDGIDAKSGGYTEEEDVRMYVINVHGLKSALASIGQAELSAFALRLEQAGRDNDAALMSAETPAFIASLRALVQELAPEAQAVPDAGPKMAEEDGRYLQERLREVKAACEEYCNKTAKTLTAELRDRAWPQAVKKLLNDIAEYLLHSDFDVVVGVIDKYLEVNDE